MRKLIWAIILIPLLTGCTTTRAQDAEITQWVTPISISAAYFSSIGIHEGSHALTASTLGAHTIKINLLPTKDSKRNQHLALTTYTHKTGKLTRKDFTLINTTGPTAQLLGHIGARELLKTQKIPRLLQPTLGWFSLFNQISTYYHTINGLTRNNATDLGKEETWISGLMLGTCLTYDIIDLIQEDKPEHKFLVLFGKHFYEPKNKNRLSLLTQPQKNGGFIAIKVNF